MNIIFWVLIGALMGYVFASNTKTMDKLTMAIVGIIGASIGGSLGEFIKFGQIAGFKVLSFILAILGAGLLLFIVYRVFESRNKDKKDYRKV